jgi:hypothetical protein
MTLKIVMMPNTITNEYNVNVYLNAKNQSTINKARKILIRAIEIIVLTAISASRPIDIS